MHKGDHQTYALQTVQWMYAGPPDVHYFLKYPLVNTCTYEAAFGPLGKNHLTFANVRYFLGSWWQPSPINSPIPPSFLTVFQMPTGCQCVFVSVL
jgi:hypothetical protein